MKNKYLTGQKILKIIKKLFPINRSITGDGNRKSLKIIKEIIPKIKIIEYKSGSKVFDWKIPPEWNIKDAYVTDNNDKKIIDFKDNNLHLLGYSTPINKIINKNELLKHLHTDSVDKNAIPYVTSYYKKNWGFCVTENFKKKLKGNSFKVFIDSSFKKNGSLTLGELILKGKSKKEIIISCNICHPSLVNNELSGPTLLSFLSKYISQKKNFYTYRILFVPETIGMISYLNKNLIKIKKNFVAGFHLTCIGDNGKFSMIESKYANSLSDKIAKDILKSRRNKIHKFTECGSDERQYNYPGINLPVVTLTRTKFGDFKEYHTSKDNLKMVSPKSLEESFLFVKDLFQRIEKTSKDYRVYSTTKCEPFLSKRGLYRSISKKNVSSYKRYMFNILYYGDGLRISQISEILGEDTKIILKIAKKLEKFKIIKLI